MHTYNPNRESNFQQQKGQQQPVYNMGAPYSGFMSQPNHFNHTFARSFASVVSCENDLGKFQQMNNANNHNKGILNSIMKHLTRPSMPPQNKDFEDFSFIHSLPDHKHINKTHFQQQPSSHHINVKMPIIGGQICQSEQVSSANIDNNPTRSFMTTLFGGYQTRQQPQTKPKQQKWFTRGFRGGNRWRSPKFHDHDVNIQKNIHEKERTSIERDIQDDICDFVLVHEMDVMKNDSNVSENNPNKTAKGSCDDLPFLCSLDDIPSVSPAVTTPPIEEESAVEGFLVLPLEASRSMPCFVPRRLTLCEKVEQIIMSSPTRINGYLKPCLKKSLRRYSECSDDFVIEFVRETNDNQEEDDYSDEISETTETDSDHDEDNIDGILQEDDDDETSDEEESPEQQLDSGVEERRVSRECLKKSNISENLYRF